MKRETRQPLKSTSTKVHSAAFISENFLWHSAPHKHGGVSFMEWGLRALKFLHCHILYGTAQHSTQLELGFLPNKNTLTKEKL